MQEPERRAGLDAERGDELPRNLQQNVRADDVSVDEGMRAVNGSIDVRLGSEVDHGGWLMRSEHARHRDAIGDVAVHEDHARILQRPFEIEQVTRVGELVDDDEPLRAVLERMADEIRADEAGATRDEEGAQSYTAAPSGY